MTEMNPENEDRVREVFELASTEPAEKWPEILRRECDSDSLRRRVQSLLDRYSRSADFLSTPAVAMFASSEAVAGPQIGEFRIQRQIGRGGMGVVYLAEDTVLRRTIALKVLPQHVNATDQAVDRFRREAQAIARLRHPGIVQIFRYGEERGVTYMAMEYVEGQTLRAALDSERQRVLPPSVKRRRSARPSTGPGLAEIVAVARRIADIADSLDHAHKLGIIHRDVKPSNILLSADGKARITDFGIAKVITEKTLTSDTEIAGSYPYMSPEQAKVIAADIDQRTDVFSLGVVLYECLTYKRPFDGETPQEIIRALDDCRPRAVDSLNNAVPRDLAVIVHKALEKLPTQRYQTAAHLAADLRCFLEGKPILARPPSLARRARHGISRNRFAVTLSALMVTTGLAAAVFLQVRHLQRERFAWLSVESPDAALDVSLQYQDPNTMQFGPPVALGQTPQMGVSGMPGCYRLVLDDRRRKSHVETSLLLARTGTAEAVHVVVDTEPFDRVADAARRNAMYVRMLPPEVVRAGMHRVEGGMYRVGRADLPDTPRRERTVMLEPFWIDECAVSNAQYRQFVVATNRKPPFLWSAVGSFEQIARRPVTNVSLADAQAYARWVGKRLPTIEEFEAATRGHEGRLFPWGDDPEKEPEGIEPDGKTLLMTQSNSSRDEINEYLRNTVDVDSPDPLQFGSPLRHHYNNVWQLSETVSVRGQGVCLVGRSWSQSPGFCTLSSRVQYPVDGNTLDVGFRCAVGEGEQHR